MSLQRLYISSQLRRRLVQHNNNQRNYLYHQLPSLSCVSYTSHHSTLATTAASNITLSRGQQPSTSTVPQHCNQRLWQYQQHCYYNSWVSSLWKQCNSITNNNVTKSFSLLNLKVPPKGSGFDNFIPKNDKNKKDDDNTGKEGEKDDRNSKFNSNNDNKGGRPNNNRNWNDLAFQALLLYAVYVFVRSGNRESDEQSISYKQRQQKQQQHDGGRDDSNVTSTAAATNSSVMLSEREIAWHDFLRLLQQQDILKVLVLNDKQTARVFLKPNAHGLSSYPPRNSLPDTFSHSMNSNDSNNDSGKSDYHRQDQEQVSGLSDHGNSQFSGSGGGTNRPVPRYYRMQIGTIESFERKLEEAERVMWGNNYSRDVPVQYTAENQWGRELLSIVPSLVLVGFTLGLSRHISNSGMFGGGGGSGIGGVFKIGKSTAKKISKEDVSVTFKDVAGCNEAKKEIMEFVDFLKDSDRFTSLGAKIPKGALLCGPPGTGKTLLAKAVAGEAGVPFYSISGSDFIEMFVGVGPSRVRDLFSEARQNAPCIVFIDEIDAVGRQRGRGGMGGNDERENTLNQLLVEMDGFDTTTGVVVLAGTNRVDILDQALTRPGRFDRQITVDKPDLEGRKDIFKVHLKGITLEDKIEDVAGSLAGLTPGFAGADIANICNEAAIVAARRKGETVSLADFEKAIDRVIGGLESNKLMSKEERSIVAHHEAGHAIAGWFLEHADPVLKVTIIPRSSGALGFAQYLPKEVFLRTQDQIMDIVCMALAGRAAEEIFFGRVTTGASDDLRRVTDLIYSTIQLYGMNSRLGQLAFPRDPNALFEERPYSEKTAKVMDEEAKTIVDQAYQRTLKLLREKKSEVEKVAALLLEKETISHDDIIDIVGARPYKGDPAYEEFIRRKKKGVVDRGTDLNEPEQGALNPGLL